MKNDSTRSSKVTPAPTGALALQNDDYSADNQQENGVSVPFYPIDGARALRQERVTIDRIDGTESISIDGRRFFRDIDLAKGIGFARPRNVRRTITKLIKAEEITDEQFIVINDNDNGQAFYLDKNAGIKLMSGTKGITENMIVAMFSMMSAPVDKASAALSEEKALFGYRQTISKMCEKNTPRAAKIALVPVVAKYARAAGLSMPDLSELIGPDQPRLEGV